MEKKGKPLNMHRINAIKNKYTLVHRFKAQILSGNSDI